MKSEHGTDPDSPRAAELDNGSTSQPSLRRHRTLVTVAIGAMVVAAAVGAWLFLGRTQPGQAGRPVPAPAGEPVPAPSGQPEQPAGLVISLPPGEVEAAQ